MGFDSFGFVAGPAGMDALVIDAIDAWCQEFTGNERCKEDIEKAGFFAEVWTRKDAVERMKAIDAATQEVTAALGW